MEKDYLSTKKAIKNLQKKSKNKTLGTCSNNSQFVSCGSPYVQVNSLNYSPFSSLNLLESIIEEKKAKQQSYVN